MENLDKNIIRQEEDGEYIWRNPNYDFRAKATEEYVRLNRNFENLYRNYTEKAKEWAIYAHGTFTIEERNPEEVEKLIKKLRSYSDILQFRERADSESSINAKLDILEEALQNEKEVLSDEFILLARKTLDDFTDLFLGLIPLKDLKQD